jgi:peptidoglycan/xylan/chitin deacetylase (PgdA/CDA1 family)
MPNKNYLILALFLTAVIILAAIFYQYHAKSSKTDIDFQSAAKTEPTDSVAEQPLSPATTTESEVATSSALSIAPKGEISRGNPNKKQIIFTFDCGAGINSVDKILAVAQKHNLKLTFFTTGKFAEQNPEVIKKFADGGHEVFNHTYSHPHLAKITDDQIKEELEKADGIISALTGATTKPFFRPPYGDRNQHVWNVAANLGYQSVYWTTDALDWMTGRTSEQTKERIYSSLKNGEIILMHVGDDITGNILDEVFTYIEERGYKIVSLTEGIR